MVPIPMTPLSAQPAFMTMVRQVMARSAPQQSSVSDAVTMGFVVRVLLWAVRERALRDLGAIRYLLFDGSQLCWIGAPYTHRCWHGVSGV